MPGVRIWGGAEAHTALLPHGVNRQHNYMYTYPMLMTKNNTNVLKQSFLLRHGMGCTGQCPECTQA